MMLLRHDITFLFMPNRVNLHEASEFFPLPNLSRGSAAG
jgi:hypothetical protein